MVHTRAQNHRAYVINRNEWFLFFYSRYGSLLKWQISPKSFRVQEISDLVYKAQKAEPFLVFLFAIKIFETKIYRTQMLPVF